MTGQQPAGSVRRRVSRAAAAVAGVCLVLAAIGPAGAQEGGAQQETARRPDVFRSSASSFVAQAFLDREGLLPVDEAFRFIALDGEGTYESSNQTARSSIFYPGNGLVSGPSLACGTFGSQFPPEFQPVIDTCLEYEYPLTVRADALDPEGTSTGGQQLGSDDDPLSGQAARASARASDAASITDAAISNLQVLGLPDVGQLDLPAPLLGDLELDASVVTVDSASSRTHQRIDESGQLRTDAEAVLDGVRLIGGLVEIDSIHSAASIVDDGSGETNQRADLEVGAVTVGGLPAELTEDGLVVGSPAGGGGPLADQFNQLVNDLLAAFDVRISTVDAEHGVDDDGVAFARSSGLLVEFDVDVGGLPVLPGPTGDIDPNGVYQGVIQLGSVGATGVANQVETPAFTPGASPAPTESTTAASPGPGPDRAPAATPDRAPEQAVAPAEPAGSGQLIVRSFEELWADRLRLVYLAFTLIGLAVCLAPRFALPARFPGASRAP